MVINKFDNKDQTIMQNQSIYLRFLSLLHAIEGKGELPNLDLDAKRLLEVIAVQHSQGKPLTVSDAMAMTQIASPATIHRKLDVLREIGMIDTYFEGKNRRTKYLCPTPQAEKYFSQVGAVMQQAGLKTA
jgi:DNA-binding MarR family transcriptional regulator